MIANENRAQAIECEAHLVAGEHIPATTHSTNPDWAGYMLCEECAAEYNARGPLGQRREMTIAERAAQNEAYEG